MCSVHLLSRNNVDLWPQGQIYRVFDMVFVRATAFSSFVIVIPYLAHECNHGMMCHIHSWLMYDLVLWPRYQNNIFTMNLCLGKIVFALLLRHNKLAHGCITLKQLVVFILDLYMSMIFDLKVNIGIFFIVTHGGYKSWKDSSVCVPNVQINLLNHVKAKFLWFCNLSIAEVFFWRLFMIDGKISAFTWISKAKSWYATDDWILMGYIAKYRFKPSKWWI